ncbi:LytR C-terminal domain-containing protein [Blastococcus sp. TF02A-26]|uniref:LytR C-terminal domain-containing protein n=1 Tax=Blastococcus sp. TF02A-26 TaxID=2250577 RepID=UPI000DEA108B|nr:LytR C-terminal domain-containing protein [Blastococcus sp. TF02A-26]RBY80738.1 hypothetical protein DQ240_21530 [Blastococcus sp. TF02A-26]
MGRHDAPGGDGRDRGNPSAPLNRRRTDARTPPPAELPDDLGDHPTSPARSRADRRREGLLEAGIDPGRPPRLGPPAPPSPARPAAAQPARLAGRPAAPSRPAAAVPPAAAAAAPARPRPVEPPAPATARPPVSAPVTAAVAAAPSRTPAPVAQPPASVPGPRTTMAPFQAVPTPEPTEHPSAPLPDVSSPGWDRIRLDEPPAAPPTVVPGEPERPAEPFRAPVGPPPATPNGNPAYRDWTRPSGAGAPPATTAIPDREIVRGRVSAPETVVPATEVPGTGAYDERFGEEPFPDQRLDEDDRFSGGRGSGLPTGARAASGPDSGSHTGVVGGRAALRAERRAAEEERRREDKRKGVRHVRTPVPGTEDDEPAPTRRRGLAALVAVVVVALLVLGVYSFTSPDTQEASDGRDQAAPTTSAPVQTSGALPPLSVEPLPPVEEAPATPVRVPVTVLNATGVTGLAGSIAGVLDEGGWPTAETGPYEGADVPVTTVYFTEGDETQRQSALQLVEAHPEVTGPAVRFFEVSETAADGLVVVAAGDWQP